MAGMRPHAKCFRARAGKELNGNFFVKALRLISNFSRKGTPSKIGGSNTEEGVFEMGGGGRRLRKTNGGVQQARTRNMM